MIDWGALPQTPSCSSTARRLGTSAAPTYSFRVFRVFRSLNNLDASKLMQWTLVTSRH